MIEHSIIEKNLEKNLVNFIQTKKTKNYFKIIKKIYLF